MASPDPEILFDGLSERLAQQIARHGIPGAAIAVLHQGRVAHAATGYANHPESIEANDRTLFQIGSITKVFTVSLALMLHEEGRLDLDAPVRRWLPDLKIQGQPAPDAITVRRLLDHTSGIDSDLFEHFGEDEGALARYVDACSRLNFVHPPGALRSYSNSAYCIAGRALEVIAGRPFNALLEERLLDPLGIAPYGHFDIDTLRHRTAVGHVWDGSPGGFVLPGRLHLPSCMAPAGSVLSLTALGLLRFGQMHLHGGVAESGQRLLSEAGVAAMQAPYAIPPEASSLRLGWGALVSEIGEFIAASGAALEQNSFLVIRPDRGFALALLTNTSGGADRILADLGLDLIEACCGVRPRTRARPPVDMPTDVRPSPDQRARLVGSYGLGTTRVDVLDQDGRLMAHIRLAWDASAPTTQSLLPLEPVDDRRFVPTPPSGGGFRVTLEFLFEEGRERASHISYGNRIYARRPEGSVP